jgi:hypothetical protein
MHCATKVSSLANNEVDLAFFPEDWPLRSLLFIPANGFQIAQAQKLSAGIAEEPCAITGGSYYAAGTNRKPRRRSFQPFSLMYLTFQPTVASYSCRRIRGNLERREFARTRRGEWEAST